MTPPRQRLHAWRGPTLSIYMALHSVAPPTDEAQVRWDAALLLLWQLGEEAGAKGHLEQAVLVYIMAHACSVFSHSLYCTVVCVTVAVPSPSAQ